MLWKMIYQFGSQLRETNLDTIIKNGDSAVIVTNENKYPYILKALGIQAEIDVSLRKR